MCTCFKFNHPDNRTRDSAGSLPFTSRAATTPISTSSRFHLMKTIEVIFKNTHRLCDFIMRCVVLETTTQNCSVWQRVQRWAPPTLIVRVLRRCLEAVSSRGRTPIHPVASTPSLASMRCRSLQKTPAAMPRACWTSSCCGKPPLEGYL